jgi:hypothetical protein
MAAGSIRSWVNSLIRRAWVWEFLAQGREVLRRILDDRRKALLLVLGGVDLDIEMPQHAVEVRLGQGLAAAPAAVRIRLGTDAGERRTCEREQSRAPEKAAPPTAFSCLFHDFLSYVWDESSLAPLCGAPFSRKVI